MRTDRKLYRTVTDATAAVVLTATIGTTVLLALTRRPCSPCCTPERRASGAKRSGQGMLSCQRAEHRQVAQGLAAFTGSAVAANHERETFCENHSGSGQSRPSAHEANMSTTT